MFALQEQLEREGVLTPERRTITGKAMGGVPFARTQIYKMLSNPLYLGLIPHQGKTYPGLHAPIIDQSLWDSVQAKLAANIQGKRRGRPDGRSALLAGKVVDDVGEPLKAAHCSKSTTSGGDGRVRYSYYVSSGRQRGRSKDGGRVPARELDALVIGKVAALFDDPLALLERAGLNVSPHDLASFECHCAVIAARVRSKDHELVRDLVSKVRVQSNGVEIDVSTGAIALATSVKLADHFASIITLISEVQLTRTGMAMRLIQGGNQLAVERPDMSLVRLVAKAHNYWRELRQGQLDITRLAAREKVSPAYVTRLLRLVFLPPQATEAILTGRQPAHHTVRALTATDAIPRRWSAMTSV